MQIFYFKNFTEAKQGQYLRLILSLTDESKGLRASLVIEIFWAKIFGHFYNTNYDY